MIELSIQKLLYNVNDKNYKGIFLYDSKYMITDGYQSIIFKDKIENNSIIEKYKIETNEQYKNIRLNIKENYYNIPIKIDLKILEDLLKERDDTGNLQPYIIKYNNTTHAINPEYLSEALKIIETDTVYITQNELEPILLKGDKINYIILPIKMNNIKYNNTLTNNEVKLIKQKLLTYLISGIIMFLFLGWIFGIFKTNPYIGTWESQSGYTITINKDGTGTMTDGVAKINFKHKYKPESLGQLAIYISGTSDTYCYINESKDAFSYEGINFRKK